jgi:hypothetical protein
MIAADQAIERVLPLPMRYAFSGVRPSSGAAITECRGASDFIGSQRVATLLRPRTGNATRIWALFFCA